MKTALISGDAGFVARHMRPMLIEAGYELTGFDIKGKPGVTHRGEGYISHEGLDARDYFRHTDQSWDLVIHLAAVVGGRAKIDGAPLDLAVDLAIDAEMFQWAMRTRPGKVVYFSSSAAYPPRLQLQHIASALREGDIDLDRIEGGDCAYGNIKLMGEMLARYAHDDGLDVLVTRVMSGYCGLTQDLDYPFPKFVQRAKHRDNPFPIWADASSQRDWVHIEDVCAAVMAFIDAGVQGPINIGTGIPTSFETLAHMICGQAGYTPNIEVIKGPMGVHTRYCDPTEMLKYYTPKIGLAEGIWRAFQ